MLTSFSHPAQTTLYNLGCFTRVDLLLVFLLLMAIASSYHVTHYLFSQKVACPPPLTEKAPRISERIRGL